MRLRWWTLKRGYLRRPPFEFHLVIRILVWKAVCHVPKVGRCNLYLDLWPTLLNIGFRSISRPTLLSPATKWKGDIGMGAVRPSFRPSVLPSFRPSVRPSRFVSGAEHKNSERYLNQTWYIDRSSGELVPFDSLGFLKKLFILLFPWFPLGRGIWVFHACLIYYWIF